MASNVASWNDASSPRKQAMTRRSWRFAEEKELVTIGSASLHISQPRSHGVCGGGRAT